MAQKRKKAPAGKKAPAPNKRRQRRWIIPKLLLLLACTALVVFIGVILFMERELRRIGIFGPEDTAVHAPAQPQRAPAPQEEITPEEKAQLMEKLQGRP